MRVFAPENCQRRKVSSLVSILSLCMTKTTDGMTEMLISPIDLATSASQTTMAEGFGNDRRCFMIPR